MRLWDDDDLTRAESEGYMRGAAAERARIAAIVATPAAKRNLGTAIEAALADISMNAENAEARIAASSGKSASSGPSSREIYNRLNVRPSQPAHASSNTTKPDVYTRCQNGG